PPRSGPHRPRPSPVPAPDPAPVAGLRDRGTTRSPPPRGCRDRVRHVPVRAGAARALVPLRAALVAVAVPVPGTTRSPPPRACPVPVARVRAVRPALEAVPVLAVLRAVPAAVAVPVRVVCGPRRA